MPVRTQVRVAIVVVLCAAAAAAAWRLDGATSMTDQNLDRQWRRWIFGTNAAWLCAQGGSPLVQGDTRVVAAKVNTMRIRVTGQCMQVGVRAWHEGGLRLLLDSIRLYFLRLCRARTCEMRLGLQTPFFNHEGGLRRL